uniref:Ubiquitin putative n=1 Tax=Albugo laibachii Nc14 TaxID=890382 RepID=F0WMR2_9STRA|nr:ubiquitin putative [Albugo laibachii Nc14]|eukprot:CCA22597.1 ubiquitin putative [Albugo laibachii Nc14]
MQITIKTLTGRKQTFNFEAENSIFHVKEALQEKEGIQVNQIRLIYSGRQLSDNKTLQDYNVLAGGTIHMVLQLRGGQSLSQI